ncbi:MAG: DUF2147 domain-containing protein [Pseudolabrys sp.]|nr:DUF2147 domain-containing protein [Pseudolabrys sp.]
MIDLLVSSIVAVFTGLLTGPSPAMTPVGPWQRADAQIEARFYACGDRLCARITASKLRNSNGKMLLNNAAKTAHNMWEGPVLDLESGEMLTGIVTIQSRDTLSLKACNSLMLCRSETWQRVR